MNNIFITATGKKDGVGSQILSKILAMIYCKKYNYIYVHTPLSKLDVKEQDIIGIKYYKHKKGKEWVNKWENFFNIKDKNVNEIQYDKIIDLTNVLTTEQITMNDNYLWHNFDPSKNIIQNIKLYPNKKLLFLVKELPKLDTYSNDIIDIVLSELRKNFNNSPKPELLFKKDIFNIVIHKRYSRGASPGKTLCTTNNHFIRIIKELNKKYSDKSVQFWIFSDGQNSNFPELKFKSDIECTLDNIPIKILTKYNSLNTYYHFIKADVLITETSSFSITAAFFNKNTVIYRPYWDKPYYKWKIYN